MMRSATLRWLMTVGVVAAAPVWADGLKKVIDAVEDALDAAKDEGGACAKRVVGSLKDLRADLRELREEGGRTLAKRVNGALRDVRDDAEERCSRDVRQPLKDAAKRFEAWRDDGGDDDTSRRRSERDRDRDRDDEPRQDRKRVSVKIPNFNNEACNRLIYMERFAQVSGDADVLPDVVALQNGYCRSGEEASGEIKWPNGRVARFADGQWRYPNGRDARFPNGQWRYPSGRDASFPDRQWRYPTGVDARFPNGAWRYPNGQDAGSETAVLAWACGKVPRACDDARPHLDAGGDWRTLTVIDLAMKASQN